MVPLDFENLKNHKEYLYFIPTQKNHIGWPIEKPIEINRTIVLELLKLSKK